MFITRFKEMLMITQCATAAKFKSDFSVCFLPQLAYKLLQTCVTRALKASGSFVLGWLFSSSG